MAARLAHHLFGYVYPFHLGRVPPADAAGWERTIRHDLGEL